jgi:hypothetical protein
VDDQGNLGGRLDRLQRLAVDLGLLLLLQVDVADRDRHRIDPGLAGETSGVLRVGAGRGLALGIADEADFTLAGDARRTGYPGDRGSLVDVLRHGFARAVEHHRGEAAIDRLAAFPGRIAVVEMSDNRDGSGLAERAEHGAEHGERGMRPAAGARLQDYGSAFGLGRRHIGARVLPAQHHESGNGIAVLQGRLQNLGQRRQRHLNFATISMIPGMVWSCAAWVGWKFCFRLRWLSPPRMVK